jgi:mono/diheme cytochrome c family protein
MGSIETKRRVTVKNQIGLAILSIMTASMTNTAFAQSGADTYKAKCQMCHAADGSGNTPAGKSTKARSFSDPDVVKLSDDDLIATTKKGKAKMPAYAGKLTDAQITDVVAYIRTLQKK